MRIRLEEYRNKRQMNQRQLSEASGVPQPMISDIETGSVLNPTVKTLYRLAQGCKARESAISTARNWWLRSPNPSNANNERNVNTDGSLTSNTAFHGTGAVAACVIM